MGNIVGEGFPDWLNTQIDVRQKVYGTINKTNEELLYLKTWIQPDSSTVICAACVVNLISALVSIYTPAVYI